jgi:hypothetical protein
LTIHFIYIFDFHIPTPIPNKQTTFFNHDLDDEAKALIGDIAPKKWDGSGDAAAEATRTDGASSWNSAGTWEERTLTPWGKVREGKGGKA